MKRFNPRRTALLASAAALLLTPAMAWAQDASPAAAIEVDELVVTAQKREQAVNDVGLSITAATGEQLEAVGVTEVTGLTRLVPGLTATSSMSNTPIITLRGVGFNEFTLGASPTVSIYVDETPLPFLPMTKGASLDLQQVEVLKGPQGILFGQNSTGGAINYIAAKPTDTYEGGADLSYGRFNEVIAGGFLSGPLSDTLSARVSFRTIQSDDWQYNYTRDATLGEQHLWMARGLLEWRPSDRAAVTFNINGWRDTSDTLGTQLVGFRLQRPSNVARANLVLAQPLAPDNARATNFGFDDDLKRNDSFIQGGVRVEYELSDVLTLTSITSLDRFTEDYSFDRDGTVLEILDIQRSDGKISDFNQELRLAGDTENLHWVVGGNYLNAKADSALRVGLTHPTNSLVFGIPFMESTTTISQDVEDYALFGNLEWRFADQFTVLGGLRYTNSARDFTGCSAGDAGLSQIFTILSGVVSGTPTPLIPTGDCVSLGPNGKPGKVVDKLNEDNISWRVGLNWEPNSDTLLYAVVSQGYKSGSFPTLSGSRSLQFAPATQESLLAYEAGAKLTFADGRVQLNGAAFYYDYEDKQVRGSVIDPIFNNLEKLVNVPKSHIAGAEIQLIAQPVEGLRVSLGGTWLETEIEEFVGLNEVGLATDFSGEALPFTPEWQAVADVEYRFPVGGRFEAWVGGNLTYNSESTSTLGSPSYAEISDFTVLDLRAGFGPEDGRWQVSAFGRNVTDEFYWTNAFANQDVIVRYAAKPITYGVKLSLRWQ
jgi:outer membrane receptor protein involved in Fe transport